MITSHFQVLPLTQLIYWMQPLFFLFTIWETEQLFLSSKQTLWKSQRSNMLFISVRQLLDKNAGFWCVNLLPSDHSGEALTGPLRGRWTASPHGTFSWKRSSEPETNSHFTRLFKAGDDQMRQLSSRQTHIYVIFSPPCWEETGTSLRPSLEQVLLGETRRRAPNTNELIHLSLRLICINLNMEHKQWSVGLLAALSSWIGSCYM